MKNPSNRILSKVKTLPLAGGIGALLLAGCVIKSIYPWYTAKDVVYDPALVGVWLSPDANAKTNEFWQFEKLGDQTYKLTVADSDDKRTEFDTRLFQLDGRRYLDCLPRNREGDGIPPHYLMRVDGIGATLDVVVMDYGWLQKLVGENPKAIQHVIVPKPVGESGEGDVVLTANTQELQAFLRKHAANTNAFADPTHLKRR